MAARGDEMDSKIWKYWIEGEDENQKLYMRDEVAFLQFLRDNAPLVCGADQMTQEEIDALPDAMDL